MSLPKTPTERETAEGMGTWIPTDASTYKAVHDDEIEKEATKLSKQEPLKLSQMRPTKTDPLNPTL